MRRGLVAGLPARSDAGAEPGLPQGFGVRPADATTPFHWLYWGKCAVTRTRDAERLVSSLEQHLSMPGSAAGDRVSLRMSAGVDMAGNAVLLPPLGAEAARFDRRLRDAGVVLVDGPFAVLDLSSRELVVEAPSVRLEPDVRSELVAELGTSKQERTVQPGRYRLDRLLFDQEPITGPQAVAAVLAALVDPVDGAGAQTVSTALQWLRIVGVTMRDVGRVVDAAC